MEESGYTDEEGSSSIQPNIAHHMGCGNFYFTQHMLNHEHYAIPTQLGWTVPTPRF